uniref:Peroxisome membrane anchor protein Pex14p N-terminal domain-containing protein n=1 Tax=Aureoumbra lagunensis TaxID=44058 RepID=A0A7S3JYB1_9STRA|mmetsp:Transcript_3195/g.4430  ORF Transcript_3195/g.4430 Transcript_3195/m.4430 type:complete len:164 (+) Transcript_3195:95-586(+)
MTEEQPLISDSEFQESVDRAHKFLKHPKVAGAPRDKAIAFLRTKNCSESIIQAALQRDQEENAETSGDEEASYQIATNAQVAKLEEGRAKKKNKKSAKTKPKRRRSLSPAGGGRDEKVESQSALVRTLLFCVLLLLSILLLIAIYILLVFLDIFPDFTQLLED